MAQAGGIDRLRDFVADWTRLVDARGGDESALLEAGRELLRDLVAHDDWLPDACAEADAEGFRQYLLHCDPLERFSVVSVVWGPGVRSPVHDHTVWGLVGVLRGAERSIGWEAPEPGKPLVARPAEELGRGEVVAVSPSIGDVHEVHNALEDAASISIHVYGGNIGAVHRSVYDPATGQASPFVSGYASATVPNLWDRSGS